MVRHYVRKTARAGWTEASLKKAMKATKKLSVKAAGLKYGIPYRTLRRHLKKKTDGTSSEKSQLGKKAVFNAQHEEDFIDYVKRMTNTYFGISLRDLRKLAYDFAERHRVNHPFQGKTAGEKWSTHFLEEHPEIEIRSLKGTRVADPLKVTTFFKRLSRVVEQYNIDVSDIYNMDEIGIVSYDGKDPELIQISGGVQVDTIFQNDGQIMTAICCFNVTGHFLPPTFVFSCEQIGKSEDLLSRVSFPKTLALFSDDGWMNREVFVDWLSFFIQRVRPSKQNKVLLLIDNDEAHISLAAYDYAIDHGVVLLSVPAFSSEVLLPLHFGIFSSIYDNFNEGLHDWRKQNPGSVVAEAQIATIFGYAYMKSASVSSALDSYEGSKIYPVEDIDDGEPLGQFDLYEPITSEDEEHLIDVLYQNGHESTVKETVNTKSKQEDSNIDTRKRRRKSLPRKRQTRANMKPIEDDEDCEDLDDSS